MFQQRQTRVHTRATEVDAAYTYSRLSTLHRRFCATRIYASGRRSTRLPFFFFARCLRAPAATALQCRLGLISIFHLVSGTAWILRPSLSFALASTVFTGGFVQKLGSPPFASGKVPYSSLRLVSETFKTRLPGEGAFLSRADRGLYLSPNLERGLSFVSVKAPTPIGSDGAQLHLLEQHAPSGSARRGVEPARGKPIRKATDTSPSEANMIRDRLAEFGQKSPAPEAGTFDVPVILPGHLALFQRSKESDPISLRGFKGRMYARTLGGEAVRLLEETVRLNADGPWEAMGLVRNETPREIGRVAVTAFLYNASGQRAGSARAVVPVPLLRPGEPAPFRISSAVPVAEVLRVQWAVEVLPLPQRVTRDLDVLVFWQIPYGLTEWRGQPRKGPPYPLELQLGYHYLPPDAESVDDLNKAEEPPWLGTVMSTIARLNKAERVCWIISHRADQTVEVSDPDFGRRGCFEELIWLWAEVQP